MHITPIAAVPNAVARSARRLRNGITLTLTLLVGSCASREPFELTLLHTNDVHARVLSIDSRGSACGPVVGATTEGSNDAEADCFGGVARRATAIQRIRSAEPNVLLFDAGDQFQGTLFFSRFKGEEIATFMNALGYDAMVVGNHELDEGPETLAIFAERLDFPLLAANIDATREPRLDALLQASTVIESGGRRIGVVGFVTEETASLSRPGPTLEFTEIEKAVSREVSQLEAAGVDIIIALSHAGYRRDLAVAATVRGLDVIIGGHTNTLLANEDPGAEGPYPTVVMSPDDEPVLVVTAYAWGKYLGRLDVAFDATGRPLSWQGGPLLLDAAIPPDPNITQLVAPFAAAVAEFANEPIGETTVLLEGDTRYCRFAECNLGNLLADALLDYGKAQGIEIALQNGGGIRSSIAAGAITSGSVLEVLPFGNTAATFGLRGEDLRFALEHGVSEAHDPNADGTGRFLQVAGMRYAWTLEQPPGARILDVEVREGDGWVQLDPDRVYQVITNDFVRNGGDGFLILQERAIDPYDLGPVVADIVSAYIRTHSPMAPGLEERVRLGSAF